jgi:hypothetical protein
MLRCRTRCRRAGLQSCRLRRCREDFPNERLDIPRLELGIKETAVEVAVVADGGAERDVNLET